MSHTEYADGRFQVYTPGLGSVGQYQTSGIPWISGSITVYDSEAAGVTGPLEIEFYNITRFVTVINTNIGANSALRVGFSSLGVTGSEGAGDNNYFILDNGESYTGEWRVGSIFLAGDAAITSASVVAGLTGIPVTSVGGWTNWTGNVGI